MLRALDENRIKADTGRIYDNIICLDETGSTNDVAKECATEGLQSVLITTDYQCGGRGRMGRVWSASKYESLAMTWLLPERLSGQIVPEMIPTITLIAGLAVAEAVIAEGIDAKIKWPNDVIVGGKKISGILTEMVSLGNVNRMMIGTGVNVSNRSFPDEIREKATSLYLETGIDVPRERLIAGISEKTASFLDQMIADTDLRSIIDRYNELLINRDREVVLSGGGYQNEHYTALGITPSGALVIKDEAGIISEVTSGEVSVRGVLGYV